MPRRVVPILPVMGELSDKTPESGVSMIQEIRGLTVVPPRGDANGELVAVPGWHIHGDDTFTALPGIHAEPDSESATTAEVSRYYGRVRLCAATPPGIKGSVIATFYSGRGTDDEATGRCLGLYVERWGSGLRAGEKAAPYVPPAPAYVGDFVIAEDGGLTAVDLTTDGATADFIETSGSERHSYIATDFNGAHWWLRYGDEECTVVKVVSGTITEIGEVPLFGPGYYEQIDLMAPDPYSEFNETAPPIVKGVGNYDGDGCWFLAAGGIEDDAGDNPGTTPVRLYKATTEGGVTLVKEYAEYLYDGAEFPDNEGALTTDTPYQIWGLCWAPNDNGTADLLLWGIMEGEAQD
jgi:hypothetical protein